MRGAGRWRLYGPLTCMGALRSDERASANRTEALYGVGANCCRALPACMRIAHFLPRVGYLEFLELTGFVGWWVGVGELWI